MTYERVIPRDLFNESKLLKCLGRLTVLIHTGELTGIRFESDGNAFDIVQLSADGGLQCRNIEFRVGDKYLNLYSIYNSKEPYPFLCETDDHGEIEVFNDDGNPTEEFLNYISTL